MKGLAFTIAALLSLPVNAQTINCATRDTVVTKLTQLGEAPAGLGLNRSGNVMEIWASDATGSWTILMTRADGETCIMSYGQHWTGAMPEKPGAPA